jgi:hypothetical protein
VNTPAPTEIDAVPDELDVGVNVAVYVVPEPLKPDNAPPETVTSPTRKSVEVLDNVNVKTSVLPTPNEPEPLREIETVGTTVSYAMLSAVLAVFPFAAASVNTPAPTEIDAVPDELDVGVNVAVYVVPEPLKPDNVPPETVTSLSIKFVEFSDNVNVSTSGEATPSDPEPLRAMEIVGTTVSYAILRAVLAVFAFAAASVNTPAPTEIDAVPDELDVGVNVAVYVVPEPLKPDNAPPETVTSPTTKFVDDSDKVNVNKSVPPTPNEPELLREIETVGGVVSIMTVPVDAAEMLPAASAA